MRELLSIFSLIVRSLRTKALLKQSAIHAKLSFLFCILTRGPSIPSKSFMKNVQEQRENMKMKICEREFPKQRVREKEKTLNGWSRKVFCCCILWRKRKKETLHKIQFGCSVRAVSPYGLVRF